MPLVMGLFAVMYFATANRIYLSPNGQSLILITN
ncbi:hypothetical protein LVISKB_1484 [Levilactobacillus brevis KB290]|uniref:Uncharacterized protein n=1 Tax=Levilactobacillus brevis KB290 TaxID=1001583 RepID=M5AEE2_LEVBR|nr:hypothetical protein LVISKB_1484 [Levilactobacillus brevis KB290]